MTRELFSEWLLTVNEKMRKEGQNILMIVDNCLAHIVNIRLTNVRLEYLPPNCTSVLQPLDQGIIRSVKSPFRKCLVQWLLINLRLQHSTAINVREAAETLTGAWWSVTSTTNQNCWKKAGLTITDGQPQTDEPAAEDSTSELWYEVAEQLAVDPSVTFDDYVQCDEATWTSAELTTDDILQSIQGTAIEDEECSDDMDDDVTAAPEDCDESVSATDALDCLQNSAYL
ncbi:tigger transposable element-derived protein 6-like [Dermacentor andersoni]|uniref:tigger transposable element-derived protein 6-like n=1 Tax=Dermacentor andersoni TaxID=34620 RepID=UPI0021552BA5|nr:tigger transposable element-derived protein 6-like [Dermacentor andersoni]